MVSVQIVELFIALQLDSNIIKNIILYRESNTEKKQWLIADEKTKWTGQKQQLLNLQSFKSLKRAKDESQKLLA